VRARVGSERENQQRVKGRWTLFWQEEW